MPKESTLLVKEEVSELSSLLRSQSNPKNVIRIQSLIYIKTKHFTTRSELASFLGYSVRSMELWLKSYKSGGITEMLIPVKKKQQRTRKVGKEIHKGLEERLNNPKEGFLSYVSAQRWVEQTYGVSINYNTLRLYMIDFFGSKIKRPRKSHIKKSEQAKADFLKLT
jgi:transposase